MRSDLIKEMSHYIEALKGLDLADFAEVCEKDAEAFESKFITLFSESAENKAGKFVPAQTLNY